MKNIVSYLILFLLFASCSQQGLMHLLIKTPKIEYQKPTNYSDLNNYQKDAVYLIELVKQTYPRLSSKIPDSDYNIQSKQLIKNLATTDNDFEFDIKIRKFMALLKDGHSNTSVDFSSEDQFHFFLFKEKENWIVANVDNSIDSAVIGSKVISINEIPMNEIEQRVLSLECSENAYYALKKFQWNITSTRYWEAIKIVKNNKILHIKTVKNGKEYVFELKRRETAKWYNVTVKEPEFSFTKQQNRGYFYQMNKNQNYAYLQMNTSVDYVCVKSEISNYTNFLTRPIALAFLKKSKKDALNFGLVLQSLFNEIQTDSVDNLIIDLRYNSGGDMRIGKQLIWYLTEKKDLLDFTQYLHVSQYFKTQIKKDYKEYNKLYKQKYKRTIPKGEINLSTEFYSNPYFYSIEKEGSPFLLDHSIPKFKGDIYFLIGIHTFSAAQILASTVSDNHLATLVGQPTGNKPTTQTGASGFKLPYSKRILSISTTFMERPDKTKNEQDALFPTIEIHPSFEDYLQGKDTQFEYILNVINKSKGL